ncbi:hypothetical protein [Pseudomonas eucalypticola]|uniref:BIG2 domain-containing protein n=1 Tax=Pseudomonas eucalypticola TaxID=2599595 RepID=A0A7D5D710_9PSED|nr:hypothetical protein [Pseudomonas eucalypticola]QKZ04312.1 hypothetical protein HWQ56_11160 [Pseudomonas eucalypticola]
MVHPNPALTPVPRVSTGTAVDGSKLEYSAPRVLEAIQGELNLSLFEGDAHVLVSPWPDAYAGQRVTLVCRGSRNDGQGGESPHVLVLRDKSPISDNEATWGIANSIPRSYLDFLKDRSELEIEMSADGAQAFDTLKLTVVANVPELEIDTTPVLFTGSIFRCLEYPGVIPKRFITQRVPINGTPPFSYGSSAQDVATVEADGKVFLHGPGTAYITVSDQQGHSKGYSVTVISGPYVFSLLPGGTWHEVADAAEGGLFPLCEADSLSACFIDVWPEDEYYFTRYSGGPGEVQIVNLRTGERKNASIDADRFRGLGGPRRI